MKVALILSALAGANAFAPASQSRAATTLAASAELEGMRGLGPENGYTVWDPLNLSDQVPVEWLRKSELSHGRSAMLATVGWVFPSLVGTFQGPVTTTDPIKAHLEADNQWWAQFILLAGVIEGVKYRAEMEGKSYTGEIGKEACIDYTGMWAKLSDAEKETMATKELKNGRLAMMGMAGFICNYFFPGTVPGADIL